jgi:hypothetical protein
MDERHGVVREERVLAAPGQGEVVADVAPALCLVEGGNGVTKPDALVKSGVMTKSS